MTAGTPSPKQLEAWLSDANKLEEPDRTAMLQWARTGLNRMESLKGASNPAQLAQSVDPGYVVTPAIDLMAAEMEWACTTHRARLLISCPPQEGKSDLAGIWTVVRALQRDPDTRIIYASYSQDLAAQATSKARGIIAAHGANAIDPLTNIPVPDQLGLQLSGKKFAATHWQIKGHKGGVVAVGLGGTITGRPADLLIIDDPLKGMAAADSLAERTKIINGFQGDLSTRLAPGAPIILIQTRWHEQDLAGWILQNDNELPVEERRWRHINIPARAEEHTPDALKRPFGEWLQSARGRTPRDWQDTQNAVGPRVWSALYQGMPTPSGGGLFSQVWFDRHRTIELPTLPLRIVSIDPAETGKGDEAGILAGGTDKHGRHYLTHDRSGRMQSDEWARTAVLLALETRSHEVLYEAFTAEQTYRRVIVQAWNDIHQQGSTLKRHGGDVTKAAAALTRLPRAPHDPLLALQQLEHLTIPTSTDPPFRIHAWRARGDKTARATGARSASSTGRLSIYRHLPQLEQQATQWQQGQDSPDRIDAAVNLYERLTKLRGDRATIATPTNRPTRQPTQHTTRISQAITPSNKP